MKVIKGIYPGVTTVELDTLAAEIAASMTTKHPDYAILAARIEVSNLHKETKSFLVVSRSQSVTTVLAQELKGCFSRPGKVWQNYVWAQLVTGYKVVQMK